MNPYPITPPDLLVRMRIDYLMDADQCQNRDRERVTLAEVLEMVQSTA